jgi:hypothetical protein
LIERGLHPVREQAVAQRSGQRVAVERVHRSEEGALLGREQPVQRRCHIRFCAGRDRDGDAALARGFEVAVLHQLSR